MSMYVETTEPKAKKLRSLMAGSLCPIDMLRAQSKIGFQLFRLRSAYSLLRVSNRIGHVGEDTFGVLALDHAACDKYSFGS